MKISFIYLQRLTLKFHNTLMLIYNFFSHNPLLAYNVRTYLPFLNILEKNSIKPKEEIQKVVTEKVAVIDWSVSLTQNDILIRHKKLMLLELYYSEVKYTIKTDSCNSTFLCVGILLHLIKIVEQ